MGGSGGLNWPTAVDKENSECRTMQTIGGAPRRRPAIPSGPTRCPKNRVVPKDMGHVPFRRGDSVSTPIRACLCRDLARVSDQLRLLRTLRRSALTRLGRRRSMCSSSRAVFGYSTAPAPLTPKPPLRFLPADRLTRPSGHADSGAYLGRGWRGECCGPQLPQAWACGPCRNSTARAPVAMPGDTRLCRAWSCTRSADSCICQLDTRPQAKPVGRSATDAAPSRVVSGSIRKRT